MVNTHHTDRQLFSDDTTRYLAQPAEIKMKDKKKIRVKPLQQVLRYDWNTVNPFGPPM